MLSVFASVVKRGRNYVALFELVQWQASSSTSIVGGISLPSIIDSPLEIVGVAPAQTTCSPVTGRTRGLATSRPSLCLL